MSSTEKATRCMPIWLGRVGSVSIAWGWMYSNSSRRPLPSGVWSMAILAWLPSSPTAVSVQSPLTVSRPSTVRPRSVKKATVASRSRTAIPTFSSLMGIRGTLPVLRPGAADGGARAAPPWRSGLAGDRLPAPVVEHRARAQHDRGADDRSDPARGLDEDGAGVDKEPAPRPPERRP